ncbi:MAG TPA: DUF5330 domain-containing protein [Rhizobiaceae bacterium]|nr:DUF5330 domain-containing protein [Rhizobiaceae bacterium]
MFLIRAVFWLTLVIAFIPANPEDLDEGQRAVSTGETMVAAQALLADLAQFCERNEEACVTGKELFAQFGAKAKAGAHGLFDYLGEQQAAETAAEAQPAPIADETNTGSVKANP